MIYSKNIENEIEFISSHFFELVENNKDELISLEEDILSKIMKHEKLKLKDEDQLLNFVNEIYKRDKKFNIMYKFVIFSNTTTKSMQNFVEIFDYNDLIINIWEVLSKRLIPNIDKDDENESTRYIEQNNSKNKITKDSNIKTFLYEKGQEFNGIIQHLTNKFGQNIDDCGIIKVTSNHIDSSNPPKNILDFNSENIFVSHSANQLDTWICFDFKNYEIEVSNYSIKSGSSSGFVKNWVIEISNDSNNWIQIDERTNYSELNGSKLIKTFEIQSKNNKYSQFIRFRNTGNYWECSYRCLRINSIEFYGQIKEKI